MAAGRGPDSREEFRESSRAGCGTFGGGPFGRCGDVSNNNIVLAKDEFGSISYESVDASDREANL